MLAAYTTTHDVISALTFTQGANPEMGVGVAAPKPVAKILL